MHCSAQERMWRQAGIGRRVGGVSERDTNIEYRRWKEERNMGEWKAAKHGSGQTGWMSRAVFILRLFCSGDVAFGTAKISRCINGSLRTIKPMREYLQHFRRWSLENPYLIAVFKRPAQLLTCRLQSKDRNLAFVYLHPSISPALTVHDPFCVRRTPFSTNSLRDTTLRLLQHSICAMNVPGGGLPGIGGGGGMDPNELQNVSSHEYSSRLRLYLLTAASNTIRLWSIRHRICARCKA